MNGMLQVLTNFFQKAKSILDASSLPVQAHVASNLNGSPKIFISVDEEKERISLDLLKSTISFEGRLREGGYGSVFSFTDIGFTDFVEGKSLAQCSFEGILQTSGSSDSLFLASLHLDELAKELRGLDDTHSIH